MYPIYQAYESRLVLAAGKITSEYQRKHSLLIALSVTALLSVAALFLSMLKILCVLALVAAGLIWMYQRVRNSWSRAGRERDYLQRGLDRMDGRWCLLESTGDEYRQKGHPYQDDLNVLGPHSLFQMLCTTRTKLGEERLARLLLEPVSLSESSLRQAAVKELITREDLRECTAFLGKTSVADCSSEDLTKWLTMSLLRVPPMLHRLMSICVSLTFLLSLGAYSKALDWHAYWPWIVGLSFPPLLSAFWYRTAVIERLTVLRPISGSLVLLFEGVQLLESQQFHSEKLRDIVATLKGSCATKRLRQLARIFWWLEQREKPYFAFTILVALGTLIISSAERWRAQHAKAIEEWSTAWATFESLQALACCAHEHPEWIFPEISQGKARYLALGLGHPLLAEQLCIRNDLSLGQGYPYLFVSGSNMAGKSTLLRAVGLNTVLAYAGGPVCAEALGLTHMHLYASVAVQDDLSAGRSRFMAEVQRLAAAMKSSREGNPVLFLIDEILSGTNSEDRCFVATAFLKKIFNGNAIGVLTSHDLSLVVDVPSEAVWRMAGDDPGDPLSFDYKLKPGLPQRSSALAIARLAGILD